MELTIQLDADRAAKLAYLQEHGNQDPASLLAQAIDQTYQTLTPPEKSAYQVFEEMGLIGCMDNETPLPETTHPAIREQLQQKRRGSLTQLKQICQEENYSLEVSDR